VQQQELVFITFQISSHYPISKVERKLKMVKREYFTRSKARRHLALAQNYFDLAEKNYWDILGLYKYLGNYFLGVVSNYYCQLS
jgi:hypothetical protein